MKFFFFFLFILWGAIPAIADFPTLQELDSHLFTNAAIIWQAPTNNLPKSFWVYERALPHVFPANVISNAIVLGSLQNRGFPRPSTNDFFIAPPEPPEYPGPISTLFGIRPGDANLYFSLPDPDAFSSKGIPDDGTIIKLGQKYASQLGIDPMKLASRKLYTHFSDTGSNTVCGRGVFFSRNLDGTVFFSEADEGESAEGFTIEFGGQGKIRSFSLRWSDIMPYKNERTATLNEITRCVRAHKLIVMPNGEESGYFRRLQALAGTETLTITKITPYYGEGIFGESPADDTPCRFITPFAELDAVADFGTSKAPVKLLSPILASEVSRMLKK